MKKFIVTLALLLVARLPMKAQTYSVTDLGTLGGSKSHAYGINNSGQVVGDADLLGDLLSRATLFGEVGTPNVDLGSLAGRSTAYSINDAGSIVGVSTGLTDVSTAFRYQGKNLLGLGGTSSSAKSINANDRIVGSDANSTVPLRFSGLGYNNFPLKGVLSTAYNGVAQDINSSNQIVGYSLNDAGYYRATIFNENGFPGQDLGTLGGSSSYAYAINDAGQIVGSASPPTGASHAVRFAAADSPTLDLGTLNQGSGFGSTTAYAINNSGVIVGTSAVGLFVSHAFIFKDGVMTDLNSLIDPALGIVITNARGINEAGQIAANGTVNGTPRALRLTPIAPPVVTFRIFLKATPPNKGTVVGGMDYPTGTLVTAIARPKRGGVFLNWTEKGKIVSRKKIYRFNATKPRNLIARFR